ncbi:MAG: type IV pili twitching motility protein PilT, partial [Pirellulales bacterium]|nr:type IV pili twitching motility protein PilT [Pirellulales bacterium]
MAGILIEKLLQAVVKQGASDLHITVGQPPVLRLDGRLRQVETKVLEPEDTVALMKSITPDRWQNELQEVGSADFGFSFGEGSRFRVSVFKQQGYVAMVLRLIPSELLTMDKLGLPRICENLCKRPRGLF